MLLEISGQWYDCTDFADFHPGGSHLLRILDHQDVTELFRANHRGPAARAALKRLPLVQRRSTPHVPSRLARDFAKLAADVEAAGFYRPCTLHYVPRAGSLALLLAASVATPHPALSAALFALFLQQIAFVGHDAGHNSVLQTPHANARLGLVVGNLLSGGAISWWKATHNTHHAATNSLDCDPDIQHAPALVLSPAFLDTPAPVYSRYHERALQISPTWRRVVRWQHWYFYPLMAVARFNLYAQSWAFVARQRDFAGALCLAGFHAGLLAWLLSWRTWGDAAAWLLLSHALAGILHVQIAVSHFFMEFYPGAAHAGTPRGERFLRTQLATTTDIECPAWMDWWHGGLQFQVAHHLFPRVPRDRLRELTAWVQAFCAEHKLAYHATGWCAANCAMVRVLREAGKAGDGSVVAEACHAAG